MARDENRKKRIDEVTKKLSAAIREQARQRWDAVRTAERNERGRHVWRFRAPDQEELFLHIDHRALVRGKNPSGRVMDRLTSEGWLDRLQDGPAAALLLTSDGRLAALPQS